MQVSTNQDPDYLQYLIFLSRYTFQPVAVTVLLTHFLLAAKPSMSQFTADQPLTSSVRPATNALITIRIVKSFPYSNVKNYIMNSVNLKELTPTQLLDQVKQIIATTASLRPYRNVEYETLKVYTHAHGTKSMNLVINFENDERDILCCRDSDNVVMPDTLLWDLGVENETELSVFNYKAYKEYKSNPEKKW